jgi:hypothetical protein
MSLWGKAIISGIVMEGILFSLLCASGWGPCGPGSPVGFVLMLAHFPATMLALPVSGLDLPDWIMMPLLFALACIWWILISYAFLVTRGRK